MASEASRPQISERWRRAIDFATTHYATTSAALVVLGIINAVAFATGYLTQFRRELI